MTYEELSMSIMLFIVIVHKEYEVDNFGIIPCIVLLVIVFWIYKIITSDE
jgi:hypothetical protein